MGAIASQITSLTIVYSTVYSDADQRKHQSSASLAFVRGIHRRPVNFPHKWPVTRKMFPFDDVIMYSDKLVLWSHDIFVFDSVKWRVMTYPWVGRRLSAHLNLNGRELCGRRCHVHIQRGFPTKAHPSWHIDAEIARVVLTIAAKDARHCVYSKRKYLSSCPFSNTGWIVL